MINPSTVTLRTATPADLPAAVEVFWTCWTRSYPAFADPELLAGLTRADAEALWADAWTRDRALVATADDDRVVGLVRYAMTDSVTEIHSLYVDPDLQGGGVGGRLLAAATGHGLVHGATDSALWVFAANTTARDFYARQGFTPDGTTRTTDQFGLTEARLRRSGTPIDTLAATLVEPVATLVDPVETTTPPAGAVVGSWTPANGTRTAAAGVRGPDGAPMTTDTVHDLASVTKLFTTAAILRLTSSGDVVLDDPLDTYLPFPGPVPTVRHLLQHRSGLLPWQPLYLQTGDLDGRHQDPGATLDLIRSLPRSAAPDQEWNYSDLGFILLGAVINTVTGNDLRTAIAELITDPLGIEVGYGPHSTGHLATSSLDDRVERRMVATGEPHPVIIDGSFDHWRDVPSTGEVNDGNAYHALGGVSGHAGLFAGIDDLITFGRALTHSDHGLWRAEVLAEFFRPGPDPEQGLGFRLRGLGSGRQLAWHPGFTGTALGVCPGPDPVVVALATNRLVTEATPMPTVRLWEYALRGLGLVPDHRERAADHREEAAEDGEDPR